MIIGLPGDIAFVLLLFHAIFPFEDGENPVVKGLKNADLVLVNATAAPIFTIFDRFCVIKLVLIRAQIRNIIVSK
jgi:hypothetical protein